MDFENRIPEWKNEGTEPSEELRTKGFEAKYKPPAAYFNWFWSKVIKCITEIQAKFKSHAEDKSNPHGVTKTQVGLGNVDNVKQASKTEIDSLAGHFGVHLADYENPHNVTAEQVGLGNATKDIANLNTRLTGLGSDLVEHASATNPHGVDKTQVGLGNVDNVKQASKTEFDVLSEVVNLHGLNKGNPHGVTAEQIGASKTSKVVGVTLLANGWKDGIYQWSNANIIKEEQAIEMIPTEGISQAQLEALQFANIVGESQGVGFVTFKAYGEIPTINIPVTFIIRGDV